MSTGGDGDATVHLRLRGRLGEDAVTALRQQLAACLSSGVTAIRVHAEEQEELDLQVLQALHGVGDYLRRRGGELTIVGARPRVRTSIAINELDHLLPRSAAQRVAPVAKQPPGAATAGSSGHLLPPREEKVP